MTVHIDSQHTLTAENQTEWVALKDHLNEIVSADPCKSAEFDDSLMEATVTCLNAVYAP